MYLIQKSSANELKERRNTLDAWQRLSMTPRYSSMASPSSKVTTGCLNLASASEWISARYNKLYLRVL
jgi:hypothetical protein